MTLASSLKNLNQIRVAQLLRPEFINRSVRIAKFVIAVLIFLMLVFIVRELLHSTISKVVGVDQQALQAVDSVNIPDREGGYKKDYSLIVKKNIFGDIKSDPKPSEDAPPETSLDFELIGTFVSDSEPPYAIIQERKVQDVFRINSSIFGKATLVAVYPDRIEMNHNGRIELLTLEDEAGQAAIKVAKGVGKIGDDEYVIDEGELDKALENLPLLLQQARAVPYFKDGKSVGLRMFAIKKESMFDKIGLKNGDVLKDVNGKSLADPSQALKLFEELKDERSISVTLERAKEVRQFKYEIR